MPRLPPPPDGHEPAKDFARRVGLSLPRMYQLRDAGMPWNGGHVPIEPALAWLRDHLDGVRSRQAKASRPGAAAAPALSHDDTKPADPDDDLPAAPSLNEARRRHELVKVERARLRLEQERGELAPWTEINRVLADFASAERDAWLNWPARVVPTLVAELQVDGARLLSALQRHVTEHLRERAERAIHVGP